MKSHLLTVVSLASLASLAELPEWSGERIDAWKERVRQISDVKVRNGVLVGSAAGRDAFFTVGCKPFAPTPTQEIVFRAKCAQTGLGEFIWATEKMKSPVQRTHSVEGQRAVVKFWLENYFNTPECLTREGMPVVWLRQPGNMDRDLGKGGCRKLLELTRQVAREAGYKGIWFIAMKFSEADCSKSLVGAYTKMGFDETGIYHFMTAYGKEESPDRFSFARCADVVKVIEG